MIPHKISEHPHRSPTHPHVSPCKPPWPTFAHDGPRISRNVDGRGLVAGSGTVPLWIPMIQILDIKKWIMNIEIFFPYRKIIRQDKTGRVYTIKSRTSVTQRRVILQSCKYVLPCIHQWIFQRSMMKNVVSKFLNTLSVAVKFCVATEYTYIVSWVLIFSSNKLAVKYDRYVYMTCK